MIIAIFSPYYTTFKSKDYYDKIQLYILTNLFVYVI